MGEVMAMESQGPEAKERVARAGAAGLVLPGQYVQGCEQ